MKLTRRQVLVAGCIRLAGVTTVLPNLQGRPATALAVGAMAASSANLEDRVRRLEDMEALRKLKHRYSAMCDNGHDPDGVASLWIEDGVWDGGQVSGRYVGRHAIAAFFGRVGPTVDFSAHLAMNEVLEVDQAGAAARGRWWYLTPYTAVRDGRKVDRWMFAEATEEYVRSGNAWLFQSLRLEVHKDAPHRRGWGADPS